MPTGAQAAGSGPGSGCVVPADAGPAAWLVRWRWTAPAMDSRLHSSALVQLHAQSGAAATCSCQAPARRAVSDERQRTQALKRAAGTHRKSRPGGDGRRDAACPGPCASLAAPAADANMATSACGQATARIGRCVQGRQRTAVPPAAAHACSCTSDHKPGGTLQHVRSATRQASTLHRLHAAAGCRRAPGDVEQSSSSSGTVLQLFSEAPVVQLDACWSKRPVTRPECREGSRPPCHAPPCLCECHMQLLHTSAPQAAPPPACHPPLAAACRRGLRRTTPPATTPSWSGPEWRHGLLAAALCSAAAASQRVRGTRRQRGGSTAAAAGLLDQGIFRGRGRPCRPGIPGRRAEGRSCLSVREPPPLRRRRARRACRCFAFARASPCLSSRTACPSRPAKRRRAHKRKQDAHRRVASSCRRVWRTTRPAQRLPGSGRA